MRRLRMAARTGVEQERHRQSFEAVGDRRGGLDFEPPIQNGEIRPYLIKQGQCDGDRMSRADHDGADIGQGLYEIECDDRVVLYARILTPVPLGVTSA